MVIFSLSFIFFSEKKRNKKTLAGKNVAPVQRFPAVWYSLALIILTLRRIKNHEINRNRGAKLERKSAWGGGRGVPRI